MSRLSPFILFLFYCSHCFSQPETDNWYFGQNVALNFSSGNPIVLNNSQMYAVEGVATQSDKNGNLLFYTNGIDVWNRNHQIMPNGSGLLGTQSSTQSGVIVPLPGSDSIFYVFTVDWIGSPNGLNYSVVDLKRGGGLGEVVQKNILLRTPVCEKIAAVRHCNNKDVWVVTHDWNSDQYVAYLVTSAGIGLSPVISSSGNLISGLGNNAMGYLRFSPDGKKLAAAHFSKGFFEVADFNPLSGVVSNALKISAEPPGFPAGGGMFPYGVEFSAGGNFLYLSTNYENSLGLTGSFYLYQYNITIHDSASIAGSRIELDREPFDSYGALQMANNGKIYLANPNRRFLHVINNPSAIGTACNFQKQAVNLSPKLSLFGLPNFIQSYFFDTYDFSLVATPTCTTLTRDFLFNNSLAYNSVKWDFGDPASGINNNSTVINPQHIFSNSGAYSISLIVFTNNPCNPSDTITKEIWIGAVDDFLGNDISICEKDSAVILVNKSRGSSILWNTGSTADNITVRSAGKYWATITKGACVYADTIDINIRPSPNFTLGPDSFVCQTKSITMAPQPFFPGATYLWNNGFTDPVQTITSPGKYWLKVKDIAGCYFIDTIDINSRPSPIFTLGNDTAICSGLVYGLNMNIPSATYLWNNGSTSNQLGVTTSGLYWGEANLNGCSNRDSINVLVKPLPTVNLGSDTTLCDGNSITLDAGNAGADYLWSTGSINQQITVQKTGRYSVRVVVDGCSTTDDIKVDTKSKPKISLGPDQPICTGMKILLDPPVTGAVLAWQDGSTGLSYSVSSPGLYYLEATNFCGTGRDSVIIYKGACKLVIPNAFTPNGDGKNDVFRVGFGENTLEFSMKIFNGWGQLVFTSNNRGKGWDGRINGSIGSVGAYVWVIEYKTIDRVKGILNGTVMLIR